MIDVSELLLPYADPLLRKFGLLAAVAAAADEDVHRPDSFDPRAPVSLEILVLLFFERAAAT
jgi:hypothetical protein